MTGVSRAIRRRTARAGAAFPPGISPLLARLYAARGVADARELEQGLAQLLPPTLLGLDTAATRLARRAGARRAHPHRR